MLKYLFKGLVDAVRAVGAVLWGFIRGWLLVLGQLLSPLTRMSPQNWKRLLVVIASLVAIGWSVRTYFTIYPREAKLTHPHYSGMGEVAAEQIVGWVGQHGQVALWKFISVPGEAPCVELLIKNFQRTLRKRSDMTLVAIEQIEGGSGLTADKFMDLMRQYADVDAIVSTAWIPPLTAESVERLASQRPRIFVAAPHQRSPGNPFAQNLVQAAVVPRMEGRASNDIPKTNRGWYDLYYRVVTPETANLLPGQYR